jgi:alkyl hydroperoxide reductase subunit AhpC
MLTYILSGFDLMIGDPSQTITRNFDVLDEEAGLAQRGTFIIDPDCQALCTK